MEFRRCWRGARIVGFCSAEASVRRRSKRAAWTLGSPYDEAWGSGREGATTPTDYVIDDHLLRAIRITPPEKGGRSSVWTSG